MANKSKYTNEPGSILYRDNKYHSFRIFAHPDFEQFVIVHFHLVRGCVVSKIASYIEAEFEDYSDDILADSSYIATISRRNDLVVYVGKENRDRNIALIIRAINSNRLRWHS